MQVRAPAKINLSFRIVGKRADGFHEVETLMAPVSLPDQLTITRYEGGGGVQFVCDDPSLPDGDDNLVVRAARSYLRAISSGASLRIELQKRIPHGAGLGGGSSDAAAVFLALNDLLGGGLGVETLGQLAAEIGSDVPFFIFRSAAICRGRGEQVTPTRFPRQLPLLLLKPMFAVQTPWAYSRWAEAEELPGISYHVQEFAGVTFVNDLERPVFEKHLFLAHTKMWLLAQPEVAVAMMSGSGSTMFAVLRDEDAAGELADRAKAELDPELWTCRCETVA
jgi:4-diphosphocytidyl-2-C-methyl-D-erythritol kinase